MEYSVATYIFYMVSVQMGLPVVSNDQTKDVH